MTRPNKPRIVKLKRGKLSQEEESFIDRYRDRQTAEHMAAKLRRPSSTVQKYLEATASLTSAKPAKREMQLADELETRPEWANFREQFTARELDHFKYRYVQLMGQFRDDVMPTEELQIFQVITLDILVQRTMKEQKEVGEDMAATHLIIEDLMSSYQQSGDPTLLNDIKSAESHYARGSDQLKTLSQRYESNLMRQSAMLKELKATRDQRVKFMENHNQSFLGFLRQLNEEEVRLAAGREMELVRLAMEQEKKRLSAPHTYHDKTVDQPFLTPETVTDY